MVPRWRAWASTGAALIFGWGSGRYGLGQAVAALAWTLLSIAVAVGVTTELCRQARSHEFEHVERRQREAAALKGDHMNTTVRSRS